MHIGGLYVVRAHTHQHCIKEKAIWLEVSTSQEQKVGCISNSETSYFLFFSPIFRNVNDTNERGYGAKTPGGGVRSSSTRTGPGGLPWTAISSTNAMRSPCPLWLSLLIVRWSWFKQKFLLKRCTSFQSISWTRTVSLCMVCSYRNLVIVVSTSLDNTAL